MKIKIILASLALSLFSTVALAQRLDCTKQDNGAFTCVEMTASVGATAVVNQSSANKPSEFPAGAFILGIVVGVVGVFIIGAIATHLDDSSSVRPSRGC